MDWKSPAVQKLIALAFEEDHAKQDITTQTLIAPAWRVRAELRAKQTGVIAGLPLAEIFFKAFDRRTRFRRKKQDGDAVRPGDILAVVEGTARGVLSAERPALNALQHLSGIATNTHLQVERLGSSKTRLYDTRKTLPAWRALEKYAVRCGGGTNHRMSLADAVLIKDNHLKICRLAGSDWAANIDRLRRRRPALPVQMEIQTARDLRDALDLKPQQVLLDNMPIDRLRYAIRLLRKHLRGVEIEISGGVKPDDLPTLGKLGVQRISMGKLTHSSRAFDCSLEITDVRA